MSTTSDSAGCLAAIGILLALFAAFMVGGSIAHDGTENGWRDKAVSHHAAEYYLDANHNRQFRWLDEEKK